MAPLGEGSLEATILDGARGRPTPSHHVTSRWDKIFQPASDCPFAADPPIRAANGPRFTRIPRTTGGRAPGSRCARRGNAVVAGQTCGPGHPRDHDPSPEPFGAREFACVACAHPPTRAPPADCLGCFVRSGGPSFGIPGARADRGLCPLRCVHRCCSSTRSAAARRGGPKRSEQTVATQRFN